MFGISQAALSIALISGDNKQLVNKILICKGDLYYGKRNSDHYR